MLARFLLLFSFPGSNSVVLDKLFSLSLCLGILDDDLSFEIDHCCVVMKCQKDNEMRVLLKVAMICDCCWSRDSGWRPSLQQH